MDFKRLRFILHIKQDPHLISKTLYAYKFNEEINIRPKKCIYFIICNGYCVYVGQSTNIQSRISMHKRHLIFDKVIIQILGDNEDINSVESYWILKLTPSLNGSFTSFEKRHYGGPMKYNEVKKICDEIWEETYQKRFLSVKDRMI